MPAETDRGDGREATETTAEDRERAVDEIYRRVLGENLHLGIFEQPDEPLQAAMARTNETVAAVLSPGRTERILDAGCGHGGMARHLARHFGCEVVAVNLSSRELARARAMTGEPALAGKIRFETADLRELPFPDRSFDGWLSQEALMHVPDKGRALGEAFRLLKPGGRLVLSDLLLRQKASEDDRRRLYARIKDGDLWQQADYLAVLNDLGFEDVHTEDWSRHVGPTYVSCLREIQRLRPELEPDLGAAFLDSYIDELHVWIGAARSEKIGWGLFVGTRPI